MLGPVTAAAEAAGVEPGMRLGEALATCPSLQLVDRDPAAAEQGWEQIVRRLEDAGFAVDPALPGCAYFDTRGVERLYGGLEPALKRALAAVEPGWDARIGAATRKFRRARSRERCPLGSGSLVVSDERTREFLAPLPLKILPVEARRREELEELGVKRLGELAGLPGAPSPNVWGRTAGAPGAWREEARTRASAGVGPRRSWRKRWSFPRPLGNELTLRRSLAVLLDRLLARPERGRTGAEEARALGASRRWRVLATHDHPPGRDRRHRPPPHGALSPKLLELPSPAVMLRLGGPRPRRVDRPAAGARPAEGDELRAHLREGLRQVRVGTGSGSVCTVVEVAPWSRLPEQRALLVPRRRLRRSLGDADQKSRTGFAGATAKALACDADQKRSYRLRRGDG
jgi:protein ImuB